MTDLNNAKGIIQRLREHDAQIMMSNHIAKHYGMIALMSAILRVCNEHPESSGPVDTRLERIAQMISDHNRR